MKVPVYQPQIRYEKAQAQQVMLARPLREASGKKEWTDAASAAGLLQGVYEWPAAVNRAIDAFGASGQNWQSEWEKLQQRVSGKKAGAVASSAAAAKSFSAFSSEPKAAPSSAGAEEQTAAGGGFSSPARLQQLRFAREEAFSPSTEVASVGMQMQSQKSAAARLDEQFLSLLSSSEVAADGAEHTLAQDYVVLRREVENLEQKATRARAQQNWQAGTSAFIQTAALIRTPRALEEYIQANINSAAEEARAMGVQAQEWAGQSQMLRRQAVRHNVEAALEAGEADRAEKVYRHFLEQLSLPQRDLLQRKILARRADLLGEKIWPAARQACVDGEGNIDKKALKDFVSAQASKEEAGFQQELTETLTARLQQSRLQDMRRRAAGYERLLAEAEQADMASLMGQEVFSAQDFEGNCKALRLYQRAPQKRSSAVLFNRLQQGVLAGKNQDKEIENALESGELSAPDYWRLKARSLRAQSGTSDARSRLLAQALERFCRQNELSAQQSQEVQYFVFTAADNVEAQINAACAVKQLFLLQESKK